MRKHQKLPAAEKEEMAKNGSMGEKDQRQKLMEIQKRDW